MTKRYERQRKTPLYGLEDLEPVAANIIQQANERGYSPVLAGGMAMQFFGSTRLTGDINFLAHEIPEGVDTIKKLTFGGVRFEDRSGIPVDWIVRDDHYADFYEEAIDNAAMVDDFPIVAPEYLAAMKLAARRPKDEEDLIFLLMTPGLIDLDKARDIVFRFVGGHFGVDEFNTVVDEAEWRKEKGPEGRKR